MVVQTGSKAPRYGPGAEATGGNRLCLPYHACNTGKMCLKVTSVTVSPDADQKPALKGSWHSEGLGGLSWLSLLGSEVVALGSVSTSFLQTEGPSLDICPCLPGTAHLLSLSRNLLLPTLII